MRKTTFADTSKTDLVSRMTWRNEPAACKRVGEKLIVQSSPKTDFWRKTY
jgi:regulation of enolase protein 1 (concanavalin A-like superfamily)